MIQFKSKSKSKNKSELKISEWENLKNEDPQTEKVLKRFKSIFNEKEEWPLHSGKWARLSLPLVLKNSDKIYAKKIDLYTNKEPLIIKYLAGPVMQNLKQISLKNNKINSIQGIYLCDFQAIEEINISDNFITNIKQIRKLSAPRLKDLVLFANKITNCNKFWQINCTEVQCLVFGLNCIANWQFLNKLCLKVQELPNSHKQIISKENQYQQLNKQKDQFKDLNQNFQQKPSKKYIIRMISIQNNRHLSKNNAKLCKRFDSSILYG